MVPKSIVNGVAGPARASSAAGRGSVTRICRRNGVTGRSTPAIAPTAADHGPAAQITTSVATGPAPVSTPVIRRPQAASSAVVMSSTSTPVSTVAPFRRAPAA